MDMPCPKEEDLACFCEGRLSRRESRKIQEHLISCPRCAEAAAIFSKDFGDEKDAPEVLITKAKGLIKDALPPEIFEVIIALKEEALEVLKTGGDIIIDNEIIPLPVLRSRQISKFPQEIKLIKEFQDSRVTLEIMRKENKRLRISLRLEDKTFRRPLRGLRIALFKKSKELESYEATTGQAVFDSVLAGEYGIRIFCENEVIGDIRLEIK